MSTESAVKHTPEWRAGTMQSTMVSPQQLSDDSEPMYTGNLISSLIHTAKSLDMRELSPDAPRYTTAEDRCRTRSSMRPDHRCILRADHGKQGFISCQFNSEDKDCIGNAEMEKRYQQELRDANNEQAMKGLDAHFEFRGGCSEES